MGAFQERIVKHALSYPNLNRLVYSTCSVYAEEDEEVVAAVLPFARKQGLDLVRCIPKWPHRGQASANLPADQADCCVRCDGDETHGFFVALFERPQFNDPPQPKAQETKRAC